MDHEMATATLHSGADTVKTILDAAAKPYTDIIDIKTLEGGFAPVIMTPEGYKATVQTSPELFNALERNLPAPLRKKCTVHLHSADSFIQYVNQHKKPDICSIWCDANFENSSANLIAIFDDHGTAATGWRDHTALYEPVQSVEWKRWIAHNRKGFSQAGFAEFIEDNLPDIASVEGMPTATQMLEMATELEINQDSRFKSQVRLQSGGVELAFVQKEDDPTLEKMRLFNQFSLGIPPFLNGSPFRLDARLRYRVKEGGLSFWYELIRPDLVFKAAAEEELAKIAESTGIAILQGNPRISRN